jgi:Glycosyl transferases group 1
MHPSSIKASRAWPTEFRNIHGRAPRILHIGNIANYAWTNAVIMRRAGADCVVLDPDNYHIVSAPEWIEADVVGDPGDAFHPCWHGMTVDGFRRPEWFINGPTPFVLRELAAREQGQPVARKAYALLSRMYRRGIASRTGNPSSFRKMMESRGQAAVAAKALLRRLTIRERAPQDTAAIRASSTQLGQEPAVSAGTTPELLHAALDHFDIVIGYALGSRFAMAAGHPRHVALEIGTLRGLVFEDTPLGQLAAAVYRNAPVTFVTNVDVLEEARRLGLKDERMVALPHPFDVEAASGFAGPVQNHAVPLFFAPARHHWRSGNASWLKGNDVLIKGAALLADRGAVFRLRFVQWGEDVEASRDLIERLGLSGYTDWIAPLPRARLWSEIKASSAVLDQFAASAFGGSSLEAMALGKPVISRLDQPNLHPFFATRPPILHAATPEEVCERMQTILDDRYDRAGYGPAGQRWMQAEHGEEEQLGRQFAAFARLVQAHGAAP